MGGPCPTSVESLCPFVADSEGPPERPQALKGTFENSTLRRCFQLQKARHVLRDGVGPILEQMCCRLEEWLALCKKRSY